MLHVHLNKQGGSVHRPSGTLPGVAIIIMSERKEGSEEAHINI